MAYDVAAIRQKIKESQQGKFNDPDEFKPAKATSATEPLKYQFFILPPLRAGEVLNKNVKITVDQEQFFIPHGNHWVNDKPYPCPRVWNGDDCPICQFGFDLMKEDKCKNDQAYRMKVISTWMPASYNTINIYFPNVSNNPEELRNRVMFYNAPKTIIDICTACLMRDDEGDPESPEAFGVFFDEMKAFKFDMRIVKEGKNNSYKTSKFFPKPQPLVKMENGEPNVKAIEAILKLRHDLFSKIDKPDSEKIKKAYNIMVDDSGDSSPNGGFDSDESTSTKTEKSSTKTKSDDSVKSSSTLDSEIAADNEPKTESKKKTEQKTETKSSKQAVVSEDDEIDEETRKLMEQLTSDED